jgi:hypothetical protein
MYDSVGRMRVKGGKPFSLALGTSLFLRFLRSRLPFLERWALLTPDICPFFSLLRYVGSTRPWTRVHYSSLNFLREVGPTRLV